jgi:regulator of sigma D
MFNAKFSMAGNPQVQHLVAELQEERSQVWGLYCQIAELKPLYDSQEIRPILSNFLQLLIDYVSLGHFGVYERLVSDPLQAGKLAYAEKIYPAFSTTTHSVISFNERYDNTLRRFKTEEFAQDLSLLGEQLAQRMDLEDELCSMLLH